MLLLCDTALKALERWPVILTYWFQPSLVPERLKIAAAHGYFAAVDWFLINSSFKTQPGLWWADLAGKLCERLILIQPVALFPLLLKNRIKIRTANCAVWFRITLDLCISRVFLSNSHLAV